MNIKFEDNVLVNLIHTTADKLPNSRGRSTDRIQLIELEKNSKYAIARSKKFYGKIPKLNFFQKIFNVIIQVKTEQGEVGFVKVNRKSLQKRLNIKPDVIRKNLQLSKDYNFTSLVSEQIKKIKQEQTPSHVVEQSVHCEKENMDVVKQDIANTLKTLPTCDDKPENNSNKQEIELDSSKIEPLAQKDDNNSEFDNNKLEPDNNKPENNSNKQEVELDSSKTEEQQQNDPKNTNSTKKEITFISIPEVTEEESDDIIRTQANEIVHLFNSDYVQTTLKNGEIDFDTVERLKEAKRQAKELQKLTSSQVTKDAMNRVIEQYDEIVKAFDALLCLQGISRTIRSAHNKDRVELYRFVNQNKYFLKSQEVLLLDTYWDSIFSSIKNKLEKEPVSKDDLKANIKLVREKMWNASLDAKEVIKLGKKITFVTGNNSAALPIILKIPQLAPVLSEKPALIPTGMLLQHHIVPLCGELSVGIAEKGVNLSALSGTAIQDLDASLEYAFAKAFRFNIESEIKIVSLYFQKFSQEEIKDKYMRSLIFSRLQIAVIRLLRMGNKEDISKMLTEINETIEKMENRKNTELVESDFLSRCEELKTLLPLFDKVAPYNFTEEELQFTQEPFPILWASVTVRGTPFFYGVDNEMIVKGVSPIGEEGFQIMFTERKRVEKMQELLKPYGMIVASFEAAHYMRSTRYFNVN